MMYIQPKAKVLEEKRIREGLTIRQLGKKAGVAHTTIVYVEQGKRNPLPSVAKKICEALGTDFDTLFEIKEGE